MAKQGTLAQDLQFAPADEETTNTLDMTAAEQAEIRIALQLQREALSTRQAEMAQRLDLLGAELAKKRMHAIQARSNFGIEQEWMEDEEMYQGVDDANRGESKFLASKPTTSGTTISNNAKPTTRSTAFLNITRPYTDAAAARIGDILLPTDDRPYSLEPVPIPELLKGMDDVHTINMPDGSQVPADQLKQAFDAQQKAAEVAAEKAETRIDDWLVECQWHAELRLLIDDWTRLGNGIIKGPIPTKKKSMAWANTNGQMGLVVNEEIKPVSKRVNPLDLFPDPACGENIHNGTFIFERDTITAKQLLELKGVPGYLPERIDLVLQEGPAMYTSEGKLHFHEHPEKWDKNKFEIWYFHGLVTEEDLSAAGWEDIAPKDDLAEVQAGVEPGVESQPAAVSSETTGVMVSAALTEGNTGAEGARIPAILTMVNDRVIKAAMHPLDSGEFPYDMVIWQRRSGMPWGMGIPRQIRTPQRMINAGIRNLMDNAGLSAKPMLVMFKDWVKKATSGTTMMPGDVYHISPEAFEAGLTNASQAISAIEIPTMQQELLGIVQFALKMAEDVTGLPQLLQGQQGAAPDTVGGMAMLESNATGVIRRIAKSFDACITEPHIRRYYEYLMMYGPEESEKGEFQIDAKGSSTFVDRDLETQFTVQCLQLSKDPAYKIDPARLFAEICKLRRFDPSKVQYTAAELKQQAAAAQQNPPPPPPEIARAQATVQAAQVRAQADVQSAQADAQAAVQRAQIESQAVLQREQQVQSNEAANAQARVALERERMAYEIQMATIGRETAMMELSVKQNISLQEIKGMLADTAIKERTKKELAAVEHRLSVGAGVQ